MDNHIKCPRCGERFEITEALKTQIGEQLLAVERQKHAKEMEEIRRQASKELLSRINLLEEENRRKEKKLREAEELELKFRKEKNAFEEEKRSFELEKQRQLDKERNSIRNKAIEEEQERVKLKLKEKDEIIERLKVSVEDLQKKASQGSQQLQGEVLELDLEGRLRNAFLHDEVIPIGKGVAGGDIIQKVRTPTGKTAGIILWETKRAKWSQIWLGKLREDARKIGATIPVLVCENVPEDIKTFGLIDGVIITSITYCLPLADILRRSIMQIAVAKSTASNKDEKLERLYQYLQSEAFRHRFEAYMEGVLEMQQDLETERRSMHRIWKKRELQIDRTLENISKMYGELQGIMGNTLPDIKTLTLPGS